MPDSYHNMEPILKENILSKLLNALFKCYEDNGISYCVLRNYEQLPYKTDNDVDIWVKNLKKAENILIKIISQLEYIILMKIKRGGIVNFLLVQKNNMNEIVHIDLLSSIQWRFTYYIEPDFIENITIRYKNFFIPNRKYQGVLNLLSGLLTRGNVRKKYRNLIWESNNSNQDLFSFFLKEAFGEKYMDILCKYIKNKKWNKIEEIIFHLKINFILRSFIKSPIKQVLRWLVYIIDIIKLLIKPPGLQVAVLGIDGAGKSTLVSELKKTINKFFIFLYFSWWFSGSLPNISQIFRSKKNNSNLEMERKENSQNTRKIKYRHEVHSFKLIIKVIYYLLDYLISYNFKYRFTKSFGGLVINDRYYYDFLIDWQIRRSFLSIWFSKVLLKIVPQPDLSFYLKIKAKDAFERKKEESINILEEQINVWNIVLKNRKNVIILDGLSPVSQNSDKARMEIIKHMIRKNGN